MSNLYDGTLIVRNGFQNTFNQLSSNINRAENQFKRFSNTSTNNANKSGRAWRDSFSGATKSFDKFYSNAKSKLAKISSGFLNMQTAISGFKAMFESGMEFQNARLVLNQAFGSEEMGAKKFKFAQNFASKTPFDTKEVANALIRAKMLGLDTSETAFNRYSDLGSFAKLTGTGDLSSVVDAVSDMRNGKWESLQTIFGIKQSQVEDFGKSNGMGKFTNKEGQITDVNKLMEVFYAYIDKIGITGMTGTFDKTFKGRLGGLGNQWQKTLASLGGINNKGEVEEGGLFDIAGKGLEKLMNALERFSKSESFGKIKRVLEQFGEALVMGLDYLTTHPEVVDILLNLGGAFIALKVVSTVLKPFSDLANSLGGLPGIIEMIKIAIGGLSKTNVGSNVAKNGFFSKLGSKAVEVGGRFSGSKLLSKVGRVGKKAVPAIVAYDIVGNIVKNTDNPIHKFANAINPGNIMAKKIGEDETDAFAWWHGMASKASTWTKNKLGIWDDYQANLAYANADKYIQGADDYLNGKADKPESLKNMNAGISQMTSPAVQIYVDKIEKDVDTDSILTKLTNVMIKNSSRNSVAYT